VVFEKSIEGVIEENYVYARALNYLGIDFFKYSNLTLAEVSELKGLTKDTIIKAFYLFDSPARLSFKELNSYPVAILTQYLKHNHTNFIKDKLPFIVDLARKSTTDPSLPHLLPEFIEDLIKHIYEEEDTIFRYVDLLQSIQSGKGKVDLKLISNFSNLSLKEEYISHLEEDDFGGIRSLIQNFIPKNLIDKVMVKEIQAFDREMIYHSEIENNVFFPKALKLEEKVFETVRALGNFN